MGKQRLLWTGEGLQFIGIDAWGKRTAIGGDPDGPGAKPADLLPLSLAACTGYDVVNILRKQRQDVLGLEIRIDSDQLQEPPFTFTRIALLVVVTGEVDERKARRAVQLSESNYCAVAATLRPTVQLEFDVEIIAPRSSGA